MEERTIRYLQSLPAIRARCGRILALAQQGGLCHFTLQLDQLDKVVDHVVNVIASKYPTLDIPPHSRWRHLDVDVPRVEGLLKKDGDRLEQTRRLVDLTVVSVLLDAGAGNVWRYREGERVYGRSEGLGVASVEMFKNGLFSSNALQPLQVDATALKALTAQDIALGMQVTPDNIMVGLEGRASLLNKLGETLETESTFFGPSARPGNLVDYLLAHPTSTPTSIEMETLWAALMQGLASIWPSRTTLFGKALGDVWPCEALKQDHVTVEDHTSLEVVHYVPFHKLTQWMAYSLVEVLERVGHLKVEHTELLTGLPEYRNGGLFVDLGVLKLTPGTLKRGLWFASQMQPDVPPLYEIPMFEPNDQAIIEWRALTVALLDIVGERVKQRLGRKDFTLAQVLEGGTWNAGREIAATLRPETKEPPIAIKSDGTLF